LKTVVLKTHCLSADGGKHFTFFKDTFIDLFALKYKGQSTKKIYPTKQWFTYLKKILSLKNLHWQRRSLMTKNQINFQVGHTDM